MRIRCTNRTPGAARLEFAQAGTNSQSITGQVRGPFCQHSRTLPSSTNVAQGTAMVVDPCYWTPKLPFLYEAKLQFETTGGTQQTRFQFGLRWCVTDRNGLRLNRKWFVVRSVSAGTDYDLEEFRTASAGLWMSDYSEETCLQASRLGVLVVCNATLTLDQTARLDQFPAVLFAKSSPALSPDIVSLVDDTPRQGSVHVVEEGSLNASTTAPESTQFVLRQSADADIKHLRRCCDELQRDVAPLGQFAGYIVSTEQNYP